MGREKNETQESGKGVERRAFEKAGRDANADRHPDGDDRRPKKDPRISQKPLKAREKAAMADALKGKYPLRRPLSALSLGKSSYFYAKKAKSNPDKHGLRDEFLKNRRVCGYRRLGQCLLPEFGRLSGKAVGRLMGEQGLSPNRKKRAKHSSYLGELSPAVPNLLNRDFSADRPSTKEQRASPSSPSATGRPASPPRSTASAACRSLGR